MIYFVGAIFWQIAWIIVLSDKPGVYAFSAATCSWIGLVLWELAMQEYRKQKRD